jgi:hypothetical protein
MTTHQGNEPSTNQVTDYYDRVAENWDAKERVWPDRSKLALLVFFSIVSVLFWAAVIEYLVRVGPFGHLLPGTQ